MRRREFLSTAAAAASLPAPLLQAQDSALVAAPMVTLDFHRLSSKLFSATGNGATMVVALGSEGLLVVDTGLAEHGALLASTLQERIAQVPVRLAINTHWHYDHVGGNAALGMERTEIVATANTKKHLQRETKIEFLNQSFAPLAKPGIPKRTVDAKGDRIVFGQVVAEVWPHTPAHTDGDAYVFFPNQNVLATGDLFFEGQYPTIDYTNGGNLAGIVAAHDKFLRLVDEKTQIVPGHGRPCGKKELAASRAMLAAVLAKLEEFRKQGVPVEEAVKRRPTLAYDEEFYLSRGARSLPPDVFARIAYESVLRAR